MINQIAEELRSFVVPLSSLKPAARNARLHPADNLTDIKDSLDRFGQDQVIVYRQADREIIKGNGRYMAMQALGWTEVAAIGVDDDVIKAMARAIADNRAGETSEWDDEILAAELQKLIETEYYDATGFDSEEVDRLLEGIKEETPAEETSREEADESADKLKELSARWGTELGQLWRLGDHFLMVGDSTDPQQVANLMQGDKFACLFTDPPYGVNLGLRAADRAQADGEGKWKKIKNDALENEALEEFCQAFLENVSRFGMVNWSGYICFANATLHILRSAILSLGIKLVPVPIIWVKQNFAIGWSCYHSQHESIYYCGPGATMSDGEESRWYGERNESTIWNVDRDSSKEYKHPTQKPVELPERGIRNSTQVGEIVLDLFGGSGATMVAAHLNKRKARVMEIDPGYAALILERVAPLVGNDVEKVDILEFDVPDGPERWASRNYRLSTDQAQIVDLAVKAIQKQLQGRNTEGRALELLAAEYLSGHPQAIQDAGTTEGE